MHKTIGTIGGIEIIAGGLQTMNPWWVTQWVGAVSIFLGFVTIWWACGRPIFKKTVL